jgi:Chaperone of endosialidase
MSHIQHRRSYDPAYVFPNIQPGELGVNTANRQIVLGDAPTGTPLAMLAVRMFAATAQYAAGDLVVENGVLWRANATIAPGAWDSTKWQLISADTSVLVQKAGDTMTGPLMLYTASPTGVLEATPKAYVDAGDQSVTAAFQAADSHKVSKSGDTMTGTLTLASDPVGNLDAATRQFVLANAVTGPPSLPEAPDGAHAYGRIGGTTPSWSAVLPLSGGTLTGPLTLAANPTAALGATTKQYTDAAVAAVPHAPFTTDAPNDGNTYGRSGGAWKSGGTYAGELRPTGGNVVVQRNGNPSLCLYPPSQGYAGGMLLSGDNQIYICSMDGNGGYSNWLARFPSGGGMHLNGGITYDPWGTHSFAWQWDGTWIHGLVDGSDVGLLPNTNWVNGNFVNTNNAIINGSGIKYPGAGGGNYIAFNNSGNILLVSSNGGYIGSVTLNTSDIALKRNMGPATRDALATLRKIGTYAYDMVIPGTDGQTQRYDIGLIAQELEQLIPQAVTAGPTENDPKGIDVAPLVAYCIRAIQQIADRLDATRRA